MLGADVVGCPSGPGQSKTSIASARTSTVEWLLAWAALRPNEPAAK
jgi:hypothetical protein